jgi:MFS transporter, DHA2 family, multidrug resistance protein
VNGAIQPPVKATRREWIGLGVLALPCLLATMDLTVLNLAVPHLTADLRPTASQLLWIVDIYGFLIAGTLIPMGTLGDHIGRRKLLLIGAAAFGTASVLAAFSTTATMLIVTRALLGIAGATLAPSTLSLIRNMFLDPRERTIAIGVWITSFSLGGAIGPLVGGLLLNHFWWGSAFLIGVPVMALLLILGPRLLPEFKDPNAGSIDWASAFLSLGAVLSLIYGLKRTAEDGVATWPSLIFFLGIVFALIFIRRQLTCAHPLIDPKLFQNRAFGACLLINSLTFFASFGYFLFVSQYLQLVLGLSPLEAGLWTLPSSAGFIVGAIAVPILVRRIHPVTLMSGGLAFAAIGYYMVSFVGGDHSLVLLVAGSVIYSLGMTPMPTLATDIILGSAPPERAGVAAALSETMVELGGSVGIAVLGSIGALIYRRDMANVVPAGLSVEDIQTARRTLGGAVAVADSLPGAASSLLLTPAREAFVHSLQFTGQLSGVMVLGLSVAAFIFLRNVPKGAK